MGRLVRSTVNTTGGDYVGMVEQGFDVRNNVSRLTTEFGGLTHTQQYFYETNTLNANSASYSKDNLPSAYKFSSVFGLFGEVRKRGGNCSMKKIISFILILSIVFTISSCGIIKDKQIVVTEKTLAELSDEEVVAACLKHIGSFRLYKNLQKYGDEFVRRDGEKMYQAFSTYVKQNKLARTDEEKLILYDSMLWQYFSSYFYDWETKEIAVNHSLLSAVFELCDKLFKTQKDTYIYCTTYTYFFDDSETLNKEIINFLFYYTIRCDSEKRFRILNDLIYVCWELNMSNEKDVCEAICFTKVLNTEIIKQESGNGKIDVNDLYELTALAKKVWADEKPSYDTLIDIYGTEPEIVYHEDNVTYLYTSDNYTSVCYGEPIYATVIFDHSNNELVYYKSKTIRGVIVDSENPESQSTNQSVDG